MNFKKNLYLYVEITENYGNRLGTYLYNNKAKFEKLFTYPQSSICETHGYRHSFLSKQLISSYFNLDSKLNVEESKMIDELFNTYIDSTIKEINDSPGEAGVIIIPAFFTIKRQEMLLLKTRLEEHFNLFAIFQYSNFFEIIENLFILHFTGGRKPFFNDFNDFCAWLNMIQIFDNIKNFIEFFKGGIFTIDSDMLYSTGGNFLENIFNILNQDIDLTSKDVREFELRRIKYLKIHPFFKSFIKELNDKNLSQQNNLKLNLFMENFCRKILKINPDSFSYYEELSIFNFKKILNVVEFLQNYGFSFFKKTIPVIINKPQSVKILNDYYEL